MEIENYIIRDHKEILNLIEAFIQSVHSYKAIDCENALHLEVDSSCTKFLNNKNEYESNQLKAELHKTFSLSDV